MITRFLLALLFLLVAASASLAQSSTQNVAQRLTSSFDAMQHARTPMLRRSVVVTSDLVTLGDLFDHAGMYAETPVFRAPAAGTRGTVPSHTIAEAAANVGMDRVDLAGLLEVSVERAGTLMSTHDFQTVIEAALNAQLIEQMGFGAGRYDVNFFQQATPMMVGTEVAENTRVDFLIAPTARSERFEASVRAPNGTELARLSGRAQRYIDVPVLARAISRGDVVRQSDLRLQSIPFARTTGTPTLTHADDVIGQAARRSLRAGLALSPDDLTEPLMVERQELVTLIYRHGSLALSVRARSMDDGAQGQSIDVTNLQSNRVVRGIVAGHGIVHVLGPMQDIAAISPTLSTPSVERIQ
jgi:flagella basal body P-ring formation protein FlgA